MMKSVDARVRELKAQGRPVDEVAMAIPAEIQARTPGGRARMASPLPPVRHSRKLRSSTEILASPEA